MNTYETVSYCGILCAKCKNYRQNMNCAGCREEEELLSDCPTRICAGRRGLLHCGDCGDFPCKELNDFYHDGNPMHLQALQNILKVKELGEKEASL